MEVKIKIGKFRELRTDKIVYEVIGVDNSRFVYDGLEYELLSSDEKIMEFGNDN